MEFEPIPDIAQKLGFNEQELTTLLMNLRPNPLVCRQSILMANIYRVIDTLDANGIVIPNDNRMTTRTRIGEPGPLLPANSQPLLITTELTDIRDSVGHQGHHEPSGDESGDERRAESADRTAIRRRRKRA